MRKYLKKEELVALVSEPKKPRDRLILMLLYETGMRVGELCDLRIGDIDFDLGEVSIQEAKWHKEGRKVPLVNQTTKWMLRTYIGDRIGRRDEKVFISNMKVPFTKRGIEHLFKRCGLAVGLEREKCHPHVLRHTHAVHALKVGIDLRTLQQNLGHSSIVTTAIYLDMNIEDRKEIYAAHPLPLMEGYHAREEDLESLPSSLEENESVARISYTLDYASNENRARG
ncbi:MAG TPA: tyrosine-type recombinase/integrase [Thermoplasmata archaeon]|jgi:site-specific recombinase XerD